MLPSTVPVRLAWAHHRLVAAGRALVAHAVGVGCVLAVRGLGASPALVAEEALVHGAVAAATAWRGTAPRALLGVLVAGLLGAGAAGWAWWVPVGAAGLAAEPWVGLSVGVGAAVGGAPGVRALVRGATAGVWSGVAWAWTTHPAGADLPTLSSQVAAAVLAALWVDRPAGGGWAAWIRRGVGAGRAIPLPEGRDVVVGSHASVDLWVSPGDGAAPVHLVLRAAGERVEVGRVDRPGRACLSGGDGDRLPVGRARVELVRLVEGGCGRG